MTLEMKTEEAVSAVQAAMDAGAGQNAAEAEVERMRHVLEKLEVGTDG